MADEIIFHQSIVEINETDWNKLSKDSPFLSFAFLSALEQSHCVKTDTGWQPLIACYYQKKHLKVAIPCYIKSHSYGEYVFDWQWANAFHRYGLEYYPKVINAIPFTPVTTSKYLYNSSEDSQLLIQLFESLLAYCKKQNYSSLHSLFITPSDKKLIEESVDLSEHSILRHDIQYHWQNNNYLDFADYLSSLQRKKRKNIVNERNSMSSQNISVTMLEGDQLKAEDWDLFYQCYLSTIGMYGSQAYLNSDFFTQIGATMADKIVMAKAQHNQHAFAYALFFKSKNGLYGRYWGSLHEVKNLHFELCYYQAIHYCIDYKLDIFEAGAQGSHKLSRGLLAKQTASAHWIFQKDFAKAIKSYVEEESKAINDYQNTLTKHSPFKDSN